jgi:acetyl esterase/lipase
MKTVADIPYGDSGIPEQRLDLYTPETGGFSTLFFLHGGGMEGGGRAGERYLGAFAEGGFGVAVPDYRLYPGAVYPQFIEDAAAALSWTVNNIGGYGGNGRIFVAGSSAGAYLAMMLCFDKKYLAFHGIDPDRMAGYIFDAGQPTVHFNVLREAGMDPRKVVVDERSPLYHISAERDYPPLLVLCADHDMENRYEQTRLFVSTMRHFGHRGVDFRLMEGYEHTRYTPLPVFRDMVLNFMSTGLMQIS